MLQLLLASLVTRLLIGLLLALLPLIGGLLLLTGLAACPLLIHLLLAWLCVLRGLLLTAALLITLLLLLLRWLCSLLLALNLRLPLLLTLTVTGLPVVYRPGQYHVIVGCRRSGNSCQACGIVMIYRRDTCRASMRYCLLRILLLISYCVYYSFRMRVRRSLNRWPVNIQSVIAHGRAAWTAYVAHIVYPYILMCSLPYFLWTRPSYVRLIISNIGVINNGGIANDSDRP